MSLSKQDVFDILTILDAAAGLSITIMEAVQVLQAAGVDIPSYEELKAQRDELRRRGETEGK